MEAILDELKIFTGNAHRGLAEEVCKYLDIPLGQAEVFKFSNDNTFVRIQENVRQRDVFIIQPTCAPVNDNIMELLIMIDACKRASAGRTTMEMAQKIAAGPPVAIRLSKLMLYKGLEFDLETAMKMAAAAETITLTSRDHEEGTKAIRESRKPAYEGR